MFYQILSIQPQPDQSIQAIIALNPDHAIFQGHFPGSPVLPGACMVQMLKAVLQRIQNGPLVLQKAANIKFISMIVPDAHQPLKLILNTQSGENGLLSVMGTLYAGDVASMKFTGTYKRLSV